MATNRERRIESLRRKIEAQVKWIETTSQRAGEQIDECLTELAALDEPTEPVRIPSLARWTNPS